MAFLAVYISQLHTEWTLNPNYAFGWGVPFLGIFLLIQRWKDRPEVNSAQNHSKISFLLLAALAFWLPIRLVREANMDWRLLSWIISLGTATGLLALAYRLGGKPWTKHFFWPIAFLLLAVPWPSRIESLVIQSLTVGVVKTTVEAMRWLGIAAWASGNVIQLPGSSLGVEDACSGLRAFQGALMCSIFFGELLRLSTGRRVALLLGGAVLALACNFSRTLLLGVLVANDTRGRFELWHDGAGIATLAICFAVLWIFSKFLAQTPARTLRGQSRVRPQWIPVPCAVLSVGWLLFVECATFLWFRSNAPPILALVDFHPSEMMHLSSIPERVRSILRFDEGSLYEG
ncbi:MAG TPA: exosortase/archaeosortase family protein, partial [Verrucomicrobiae bacterium]|nr:exosortase/archaeosortase family protein [Verrucomicrobiae bacterium]